MKGGESRALDEVREFTQLRRLFSSGPVKTSGKDPEMELSPNGLVRCGSARPKPDHEGIGGLSVLVTFA